MAGLSGNQTAPTPNPAKGSPRPHGPPYWLFRLLATRAPFLCVKGWDWLSASDYKASGVRRAIAIWNRLVRSRWWGRGGLVACPKWPAGLRAGRRARTDGISWKPRYNNLRSLYPSPPCLSLPCKESIIATAILRTLSQSPFRYPSASASASPTPRLLCGSPVLPRLTTCGSHVRRGVAAPNVVAFHDCGRRSTTLTTPMTT